METVRSQNQNEKGMAEHPGRVRQIAERGYMPPGMARYPWDAGEVELSSRGVTLTRLGEVVWKALGHQVQIAPAKDWGVFRIRYGDGGLEFMPDDVETFTADLESALVQPEPARVGTDPGVVPGSQGRPGQVEPRSDPERSAMFAYGAVVAVVLIVVGLSLASTDIGEVAFNVVMFSVLALAFGGWMVPGIQEVFAPSRDPDDAVPGIGFAVFSLVLLIGAGGLAVSLYADGIPLPVLVAPWIVVFLAFAIRPVRRIFDHLGTGLIFLAVYLIAVGLILGQVAILGLYLWAWGTGRLRIGLVWVLLLFGVGSYLVFRQFRWAARTGWETVGDLAIQLTDTVRKSRRK